MVLGAHHIELFQVDRKGRWRFEVYPVPKMSVHLPLPQGYEIRHKLCLQHRRSVRQVCRARAQIPSLVPPTYSLRLLVAVT